MKRLTYAWPVGGQMLSAGLSALATTLIYYVFPATTASVFFGLSASVSIVSTLGAFGQQRVLARDIAKSRRSEASLVELVLTRVRFTAIVAAGAAVLCGVLQYFASGISPTLVTILVLWTFVDGLRGVLADAHFGLHLERRAVLVGDATRWTVNLVGILVYVGIDKNPSLTGLALIALLSVTSTALLAGASLARIAGITVGSIRGLPIALPKEDLRSGVVTTAGTVAAALSSQGSIVMASLILPAGEAATFAFGMRVAAGLTLVQNGLVKVVLPRAVVLVDQDAPQDERQHAVRFIMTTTRIAVTATVALLAVAVGLFAFFDGRRILVFTVAILGVASILNVAAGPVGAVLVAIRKEAPVLWSNVAFGTIGVLAPVLHEIGVTYLAFVAVLGLSIALHNGVLAGVTKRHLDVRLGLWAIMMPRTRENASRHRLERET